MKSQDEPIQLIGDCHRDEDQIGMGTEGRNCALLQVRLWSRLLGLSFRSRLRQCQTREQFPCDERAGDKKDKATGPSLHNSPQLPTSHTLSIVEEISRRDRRWRRRGWNRPLSIEIREESLTRYLSKSVK